MQLKHRSLRHSLQLATCSLLQLGATSSHAAGDNNDDIDIDSAVMIYTESNGRVSLLEPIVRASKAIGDDETLSLQIVADTLTGATPNGAHASSVPQTFTSPSGEGSYTVPAGETPLDTSFHDARGAITISWDKPIDRLTRRILGASLSSEFDWTSLGASATFTHDYNNRNTTLSAGAALTYDYIAPVGDAPTPLAAMQPPSASQPKEGTEDRTTVDLLIGMTQVISRQTLMQFNYGNSQSSGYHNDPYKILSITDDSNPLAASYGTPTGTYLYESRPDSRNRQTIYWKTVHHLTEDVVHVAYRYYWDDWGINSHTLDLKYRYELSETSYLQPHLRLYSQSAADFYHHSLLDSEALPEYASADYRLAEFNSTTVGLKYGRILGDNNEFSLRLEFIQQQGDSSPTDAIGDQLNQDLYPTLNATVLQASYSFIW